MKYEAYIDQIVVNDMINQDETLLSENGKLVTVADFIEKTKQMKPWHRRLLNDLTEIRKSCGDVRSYMRKYTEEKVNDGFEFIKQKS